MKQRTFSRSPRLSSHWPRRYRARTNARLAAGLHPGEAVHLAGEHGHLAVVDLKTFKQTKTLKVGMHPHGQASPASQDKLYVAAEIGGTVTLIDTIRDEVVKTFNVGFGVEPQNGAITPDGRFLYQPSYAGYWQVFDTQKEQIIEYIHTLGIGHNTVMAPDGRFAYLLPILGGPGHFARPSLGLPRTQPKEVTVVDARAHKVVGTIAVGSGPRPGTISPDGKRLYMNVDDLMGFLVIDTEARKVISQSDLHVDEGRGGREKPIARHCGRERRQGSLEQRRRPQSDVRVRRHGESTEADRALRGGPPAVLDHVVERQQDDLRRRVPAATS